jgi:hypothetical protein
MPAELSLTGKSLTAILSPEQAKAQAAKGPGTQAGVTDTKPAAPGRNLDVEIEL